MLQILTFGLSGVTRGGIETFVMAFAEQTGEQCTYDLVLTEDNTIADYAHTARHIYRIAPYHKQPLRYIRDIVRLVRRHRREIDAVWYNQFNTINILPILVCRCMGLKVILHAHNNDVPQRSRLYRIVNGFGRQLCGCFSALRLSNSDASTRFIYPRRRWADTHIIYNAIHVERFAFDAARRQALRQAMGIAEGTRVVGFVGRLAAQKNPLFALDIFHALHERHPDTVLVMVGDGPLRSQVEERVAALSLKEAVRLPGRRDDVPALYSAFDVMLTPSLFEGLGIVLVEAQAGGLPCLTTSGTVPDMVTVTSLVHRETLEAPAGRWAEHLCRIMTEAPANRAAYMAQVQASPFNIATEGQRFVHILRRFVNESTD